jgi:hypothetical protein
MSTKTVDRVRTSYGWSAQKKTPAEIAGDIRQTKYRLSADVDAIKRKLARRAKWPIAALGLAFMVLVVRRIRH